MRNLGEALLELTLEQKGKNKKYVPLLALPWGAGWFLQWGESRSGFTAGAGGRVQCSAHYLEGAVCRDYEQYSAFAPGT